MMNQESGVPHRRKWWIPNLNEYASVRRPTLWDAQGVDGRDTHESKGKDEEYP
ncbi:MAG: hypothetical protein GW893_14090 [Armatimonadetes bacterium]|nr:hypothetical protein [Armatimonadota bacterium]